MASCLLKASKYYLIQVLLKTSPKFQGFEETDLPASAGCKFRAVIVGAKKNPGSKSPGK
jgi:hypothetical protein